jgi:NAD(P)-dependent dehydrogenase (short-subunit alcohol dehydrogenase family)
MSADSTTASAKLALVTGAAQGIGAAAVQRLVRDGYRVIALDKTAVEATDDPIIGCAFDLAQTHEINPLIENLVGTHGPITTLVNNAGIWTGGPITELSDEIWQQVLAVNLTAPFALIRALAPVMTQAGGGSIVNIASRNAFRSSVNNAAYDASKAGVLALTRTAAGELARHNIRVNAVCPGVVSTPGDPSIEEPLFKAAYTKQIPMDRYGTPDELAGVIAFLLSADSGFVTGQSIIVDGGQLACQDNQRFMEIPGL